jgi:hypothetical protein
MANKLQSFEQLEAWKTAQDLAVAFHPGKP